MPGLVAAPGSYRGRLAPSPTGYLHLGHAATFLEAQARAAASGGALVLRIEDLDHDRCRPAYTDAMLEDLRWAGLRWREGPDIGGPYAPYRQSERLAFYLMAWRRLADAGAIYPCTCTRRDVARAARAPHAGEGQPIYSGCCRPAASKRVRLTVPGTSNWRFRVPSFEPVQFVDGHAGAQRFIAGQDFGDFIVWRKDGVPAYQFAVVVDDAAMGISEVVRGADLLPSTAQQILLYRALGLSPPAFYHCPLVTDTAGLRLAKRAHAQSLRALRAAGADPASLFAAPGVSV